MKHYFWAAAALCCLLTVNSCDKNALHTLGSAHVSINTATLYDKLEITDLIAGKLAEDEDWKVTDSVLVYDRQGKLVAKLGAETNELKTIDVSLDALPLGTYTVLAWQTMRSDSDLDPDWLLMDADQLSSAHIDFVTNTVAPLYYLAIGQYSTTLTIGNETATVRAEMEPMGSIVDFRLDGFTQKSDYSIIYLYSWSKEPAVNGFYLDPARNESDRWVSLEDQTDMLIAALVPIPVGPEGKRFTFFHGENKPFRIYGTDKATREKKYIIDARYDLNSGTNAVCYFNLDRISYQPPYFGPAAGFAEWKAKRDDGFLISDPCLQWGTDYQTVRNRIESQPWWKPVNDDLEQDAHGWRRYYSIAKRLYEIYYFNEEGGKDLFRVIVFTEDDKAPIGVAMQHVSKQGFELKGALQSTDTPDTYWYVFLSPDGKTEVMILPNGAIGWEITYKPTDPDELANVIPIMG